MNPAPRTSSPATGVRVVLVASVLAQFIVLYAPTDGGPPLFPHLDKLVHLSIFAVPALLSSIVPRWSWCVAALVVHAPVSEAIQAAALPGRSGDPLDAVTDLVGVALGVGAGLIWRARRGW